MPTGFPSPHDDDSEDVAWGLTTGSALWKQGERYDAIVWLKRAVESASEAGLATRADELNRAATDLIASLAVPAPAPLAPVRATPPPPAPLAPVTPPPAPRTPPPAPPPPSVPALPVEQIAPKLAPSMPSPPKPPPVPARKGPTPPKPPPPMKSRLPAPTGQSAAPPPGSAPKIPLPPPRAPMPSVTTSAPPLEELTSHPPVKEQPHDVPPPPTITPDIEPAPPPAAAVAMEAHSDEAQGAGVDIATDDVAVAAPEPVPVAEAADEPAAAPDLASQLEPEETAAAEGPGLASVLEPEPEPVPAAEPEGPFFLGALEASGELTDDQRRALFDSVTVQSISADEEVIVTGLALVIDGLASVQATISDVAAGTLKAGEALYAKSSIPDALSLRLVAEADPTKIAIWDLDAIEAALAGSSTLLEGLTQASNRLQAIAGCTMGPLGDRLDEGLRASAIERLEVRVLQPDEIVASAGLPVPGMIIVGIGSVELEPTGDALGPGDFLFATEVLGGEAAPATARAGAKGAIIFFGARAMAQDLLVSCPPLLEIFAGM